MFDVIIPAVVFGLSISSSIAVGFMLCYLLKKENQEQRQSPDIVVECIAGRQWSKEQRR